MTPQQAEELREGKIRSAAQVAYADVRHIVGDNKQLAEVLIRLSHEAYHEGMEETAAMVKVAESGLKRIEEGAIGCTSATGYKEATMKAATRTLAEMKAAQKKELTK